MQKQRLTYAEISAVCLELSLFFGAGSSSADALMLLGDETESKKLKACFCDMAKNVDEGMSLSEAFEKSGVFPDDVCKMLRVGEQTGRIEETLHQLHLYYDGRDAQDRALSATVTYPSFLLVIALAVICVLLCKVVPIFGSVYASLGGTIGGIGSLVLSVGEWMSGAMPIIVALFTCTVLFLVCFSCSQRLRDRLFYGGRKYKGTVKKMCMAQFAQALSMALCSGLDAESAISLATSLVSHIAAEQCKRCMALLENGESIADAIELSSLMPHTECRLLKIGFAAGGGESACKEAAKRLMREAKDAEERRTAFIEPFTVVVSSLLIGVILLAVMLPLTKIMSAI